VLYALSLNKKVKPIRFFMVYLAYAVTVHVRMVEPKLPFIHF
jgi:hypothetical protein